MKLIIMRGLPGSGKSTIARKEVETAGNLGRVNRDDLRAMLFNSVWTGKREAVVVDCEKAIAKVLFSHGMNVIVDDTNLSDHHKDMWSGVAKEAGQQFNINNLLDTPISTCMIQDALREKSVGRAVIDRMALQNGLIDWGEKPILLVDVDGTIANGDHRTHHVKGDKKDWDTYFSLMSADTPVDWVIEKVRNHRATHTICICSGRPDTYQKETLAWLERYDVPFDWIFMRPGSDKRPDVDIKLGFLKFIPKEKITLVLDDRPIVCRAWESQGLNVEWVRGRDCEEF